MSMSHINNNNNIRRNNVNPNAGVWSGGFLEPEPQPRQQQNVSRRTVSRNYSRSADMRLEADTFLQRTVQMGQRAGAEMARAGMYGAAVTGSMAPGFHGEKTGGFPSSARRLGGEDGFFDRVVDEHRSQRSLNRGTPPLALNAGPRVHTVGPQKKVTPGPGGVDFEQMTRRALGPGPSSQFPKSSISAELAETSALMGGKTASASPRGLDRFPPPSQEKTVRRRAGGKNISGLIDRTLS